MNDGFRILTGRQSDKSILGQPFYKLFAHDESERPKLATCHSPLGDFDEHLVRLTQGKTTTRRSKNKDTKSSDLVCKIQVKPIFNPIPHKGPAAQSLLHYAVVLEEVRVPHGSLAYA
jgi:hypothetical protein